MKAWQHFVPIEIKSIIVSFNNYTHVCLNAVSWTLKRKGSRGPTPSAAHCPATFVKCSVEGTVPVCCADTHAGQTQTIKPNPKNYLKSTDNQ